MLKIFSLSLMHLKSEDRDMDRVFLFLFFPRSRVGVELSIECMGSAFLLFQERKRKMIFT